ncbi:MAG: PilZ domain-containing protein [Lachnospira sp.]
MLLMELEENNKLIIEINFNGNKYEFPSKVLGKENDYILAEPVRINGKVLGFGKDEKLEVNLVNIRNDKSPMVWKRVSIATVLNKGSTQYKIMCATEGYELNRREAFRLFLGINGVAQIGINKKAVDVIVKDVSETGFSFVSSEDMEADGLPVRLVFADMQYKFSLMGIIVRKVVLDENKLLYGCRISVENASLPKYINEKQRQMISINRNNAASRTKEMLEKALKEPTREEKEEEAELKKRIKNDGTHSNRNIGSVGRVERREIFKDIHSGRKV